MIDTTEDYAFHVSQKPVDRIFDFHTKIMDHKLRDTFNGIDNPTKMLMTEAFTEGFQYGKDSVNRKDYKQGYADGIEYAKAQVNTIWEK